MPATTLNIPDAHPPDATRLPGARPDQPFAAGGDKQISARDFAERLGQFQRPEDAEGDPARNTAKELIAQGLVLPMLKMMRESAFKTEMFHGGQGEKAFGKQLDQRMARQVAERVAPELVDAVYKQVQGNTGPGASDDGDGTAAGPGRATDKAPGKEVDRHG